MPSLRVSQVMVRVGFVGFAALIVFVIGAACRQGSPDTGVSRDPGEPLPGLSDAQLVRFEQVKVWFNRGFSPEEGLGPLYNQDRCSSCHGLPTSGGAGVEDEKRATRFEGGRCDLLHGEGGDNIQRTSTPLLRAHGVNWESTPRNATALVHVIPPPLYGMGLVEAIPDSVLLAREDPNDADGDGISGRAVRLSGGRIGRFRRKVDFADLARLVEAAFAGELGVTTPLYPTEQTINGLPVPAETDPTPDPEIDGSVTEAVADYVRFLAPPAPAVPSSRAARDTVAAGEKLFGVIGCASCHVVSMQTGRSETSALDRQTIRLYSDLLLHDMGPDFANVCGSTAGPSELRTGLLIGLRYRPSFLQDGRTNSLRQAILLHGGEARASRDAFDRLDGERKQYLLSFLYSL